MSSDTFQQKTIEEESRQLTIRAIEERLQLTYEQRIEAHEKARELMEDLKKIGEAFRAELKASS